MQQENHSQSDSVSDNDGHSHAFSLITFYFKKC